MLSDDPMRELIVDILARNERGDLANDIDDRSRSLPIDFLIDLTLAMAHLQCSSAPKTAPWRVDVCSNYHTHPDGYICES